MKRITLASVACHALAAGFATWAGWVDLRNDDVQVAVVLLAGGAFLCAFLVPDHAISLAFIVGEGVPIAHVIARATGMTLPYPTTLPATLLAFVPAGLGALAAVVVRKLAARRAGASPPVLPPR